MEFSLDLFINKEDLKKLGLSEELIYWGDESFSQDPQKYSFNEYLFFEKNISNEIFEKYYYRTVNEKINFNDYIGLRLLGNAISDLEWIVNRKEEEFANNKLIYFLKKLYTLSEFVIFFIKNGDEIDEQVYIYSEKELIDIIHDRLNWEISSGGVLITKK